MFPGGMLDQRVTLVRVSYPTDEIEGRGKPVPTKIGKRFAKKVPSPSSVRFFADESDLLEACDFWIDNQPSVKLVIDDKIEASNGLQYDVTAIHDYGTHLRVSCERKKGN